MKATAETKWPQGQLFCFFIFNYACFVLPAFSRRATAKNWKKKQCLPRLVSLAQRRLVRLAATAPLISFAGLTRLPGGPIDSQILPFCILDAFTFKLCHRCSYRLPGGPIDAASDACI